MRHSDPALWESLRGIEQQFQAILDERIDRGLEPADGLAEDSIGFLA